MNICQSHALKLEEQLHSRSTFQVVLESFIYGSIAAIAFIGNLLVLYIVYKTPRLRTVPGLFLASLSLSDITMACLGTPPSVISLIKGRWISGFAACQLQGFVVIATVSASLLNMALMSVDRYFRVVRPTKHRLLFTMPRARLMTGAVWVIALTTPIPYLGSGKRFIFHPGKFFCFHQEKQSFASSVIYVYMLASLAVLTFCYVKVFRNLQLNTRRVKNLRVAFETQNNNTKISTEEIKLTRTLFVTVLGYLICWTPILVIDFVDMGLGCWFQSRGIYVLYTMIGLTSSSLNPFIYGALNKTFRRGYKKLFCFRAVFEQAAEHSCELSNSKYLDRGRQRLGNELWIMSFRLRKFGEAVRWPNDKGVKPAKGHPGLMSFFDHFFELHFFPETNWLYPANSGMLYKLARSAS